MARLLLDGYNLIGVLHRDMDKARLALLEALISYNKKRGHEITVVFDGWRGGTREGTRTAHGGIRIIFSRLGETADVVIKHLIKENEGKGLIVVSSDREIQRAAWAARAVPIGSEEFLERLSSKGEKTGTLNLYPMSPEEDLEEEGPPGKRGRTFSKKETLSKKEKARERALIKLR